MTEQTEFEFVPVYTALGHLAGEMVRMLLEAQDIPAIIRQEGAGIAIGLTVGSLGLAHVCVPENRVEEAKKILQDMDEGKLAAQADAELSNDLEPDQSADVNTDTTQTD